MLRGFSVQERIANSGLRRYMTQTGLGAFYQDGVIYYASHAIAARREIRAHELAHHRQAQFFGNMLYTTLYRIGAALGYTRNPFELHANWCERQR